MKETAPPPGRTPPKMTNARFRGGAATKLLGTLRGSGTLIGGPGPVAVSYSLDVYESRQMRSGNGTLDGDFAAMVPPEDAPEPAEDDAPVAEPAYRLRLSDGGELGVSLTNIEADGAEFETTGAIPGY